MITYLVLQMKNSQSTKKIQNKNFLSAKNLALTRLLSQADSPEEQRESNPTPILSQPIQSLNTAHPDSLNSLLSKAQNVLKSSSRNIHEGRNLKRIEQKFEQKADGAFLTGVLVRQPEVKEQIQEQTGDALEQEVLKLLKRKTLDDQLLELKRQIKLTNGQLQSYGRQVRGTEKSIHKLADRYNSYFNLKVPVQSSTVDFSGLSYFELKNVKRIMKKEE